MQVGWQGLGRVVGSVWVGWQVLGRVVNTKILFGIDMVGSRWAGRV